MEDIFFNDIKKQIEFKFTVEGWITVYKCIPNSYLFSSIVSIDRVYTALEDYRWDITYSDSNKAGFKPLIYYRENFGQYSNYVELLQDFILHHNLYEKNISPNNKEYLCIDSNGDEEVVAKITKNEVVIKLRLLKDYISAKGKHFFVYFDFMRYSDKSLAELKGDETNQNIREAECYVYNQTFGDNNIGTNKQEKIFGRIFGKVLIKNVANWKDIEEQYADFIVGYDENGNEKFFTCNEDKLGNYFDKNPDAPHYLTPVFFKKEVLRQYQSDAKKYSVEDGIIHCNGKWSLYLDNNCNDYVIVCLGDLGKDLHYKEQLYWKRFNIAPPPKGGFSHATRTRFFDGDFCEPEQPDLYLKVKLSKFNNAWIEKYKWHLFKPLTEEDEHYLQTLHLLTTSDNQKEFDEQILALTKIFIDSLNEKELSSNIEQIKNNPKGIDKFERFLEYNNVKSPQMITFFRNVQKLRSTTVAHRRSTEGIDKKLSKYFDFNNNRLEKVLEDVFIKFICALNTLEKQFLNDKKNT